MKVIFWNIRHSKDKFSATLKEFAGDADILVLAESKMSDLEVKNCTGLDRVQGKTRLDYTDSTPKVYCRAAKVRLEHYSTAVSKRMAFFLMDTVECGEVILGALHFPSKLDYAQDNQLQIANSYVNWLGEVEQQRKHRRTILLGDFNMNPFELGMISPKGFNATLSSTIAMEGPRRYQYESFEYFYNPMWNWLGDRAFHSGALKLPGSYYYKTTTDVAQIYWNVFDKVIVRPELIDAIDYGSLKILEATPIAQFTHPNINNSVDHLPISFSLKLSQL